MITWSAPPRAHQVAAAGEKLLHAVRWKVQDAGIAWLVDATWDEERFEASLTRGELVIRADFVMDPPWWMRQLEARDDLSRLLTATHRQYADADEDGYRLQETEIDGAMELLQLAPGVRMGSGGGGGRDRFFRLGDHRGLLWEQAKAEGWGRVL